jgi:hypothetical protein
VSTDDERRQAIEQHRGASESGDSEVEPRIYAEDTTYPDPPVTRTGLIAARPSGGGPVLDARARVSLWGGGAAIAGLP